MKETKIIEVKKDSLIYTISYNKKNAIRTRVVDNNGIEHDRKARELLRYKVKELSICSKGDGFLYNKNGNELNTNSYFEAIWKHLLNQSDDFDFYPIITAIRKKVNNLEYISSEKSFVFLIATSFFEYFYELGLDLTKDYFIDFEKQLFDNLETKDKYLDLFIQINGKKID